MNSLLESNLREIYHAFQFPSKEATPTLVSNSLCTRIYDARYCWGRLWCWFYQVASWITGKPWHPPKLREAVLNTHLLFHRELAKVQKAHQQYLSYLEQSGQGYLVSEDSCLSARHSISKWNNATKPFLKAMKEKNIEQWLQNATQHKLPFPLFSCAETAQIHAIQNLIDIEGLLEAPWPFAILKKLIRGKPLNTLDDKVLEKWIRKVNQHDLSINVFHRSLKTLHELYRKKKQEKPSPSLSCDELALFLEDRGCKIFQKKDSKHLAWRKKIGEGARLPFNDREILLGAELFPKAAGSDRTRVYPVIGQHNRVALIAQNRLALSLKDLRMQSQSNFGAAPARFLEISSDGKIAIAERFQPLHSMKWTSTEGQAPTVEDLKKIQPLIVLVQEWMRQKSTPSAFSPGHLMLDEKLQLKATKPFVKGPFDFNAIEDFIVACAAGHLGVYQEIMRKTGMSVHGTAMFYRDIVEHVLRNEAISAENLAAIYKITDPKIVDRAAQLAEGIKSTRNTCLQKMREAFPTQHPQELEKTLNKILLECYVECSTAGALWPSFAEIVAKKLSLSRG